MTANTTKELVTYKSLCAEYYDLDKPNAPEDALAFYREYAQQSKGPILEPMCGSGRFLLPMLASGLDITGFDASHFMVDALREKAENLSISPRIWQGFLQDLADTKLYELIFIPSGSFGLITRMDEIREGLKKIHNHLSDEGVFVFEVETKQAAPESTNIWNGSIQERADGKMIALSTLALPLKGDIGTTICKYELIDGHTIVKTEVEKFEIRLYEPKDLCTLLKEVGFRKVQMIKAFVPSSKPAENDEVVVYECRK